MVGPRKGQLLGSLNLGVDSEFIAARDRSKDSWDVLVDQKIRIATHNNALCRILGGLEHFGNADVCLSGTVTDLIGSRKTFAKALLVAGREDKDLGECLLDLSRASGSPFALVRPFLHFP